MLDRQETLDTVRSACPLCGTHRFAPLFRGAEFPYWRCASCALMFADGRPNANFQPSIDDFEPAYRQYLDEGPVDILNLDDTVAWIESHVSLGSATVRVLDVGAGSGKLVRRLRRTRPCHVSAIEPSGALFKTYDLETLGIEPIALPELATRQPSTYDVVTVLDVIEHIPEAAEFVQALSRVTKPGGYVFVSTPDAGGVLARLLGRHWHHCNAYHFSLYSSQAIIEAARLGGFRILAVEHHSKRMSLDYLWNYARDFLFGRRRRSGTYSPSRYTLSVNLGDTLYAVWRRSP